METNKRLDKVEEEISRIRKALDIIADENDILKIDLANTTIEKLKIRRDRERFYSEQIRQMDYYYEKLNKKLASVKKLFDDINEKYDEIYKENQTLLSKKSETILNEVLRQAEEIMKETGENPFDLN